MASSPAFQFYPADWLVGTLTMSLAEEAAYLRLIGHQWSVGAIPGDDLPALARIIRVSERDAAKLWASVRNKFTKSDDGLWRNARLESERAKQQAFRDSRIEAGRRGGLAKAKQNPSTASDLLELPASTATILPVANTLAKPSSSSSSSSSKEQEQEPAPVALLVHTTASKPRRYEHALIPKRDLSAVYEGRYVNIPAGRWAEGHRKAYRLTDDDLAAFGKWVNAEIERDGGIVCDGGNRLRYLDERLDKWRGDRADDEKTKRSIAATRAWQAEQDRIKAEIERETAEAKANGTYKTFAEIAAEVREARKAELAAQRG